MKWLFQLRVGLSPLYAHKKNNNFSDTLCDKCDVCKRAENLEHFFLNCMRFTETRRTLLNSVLTLNVNFNQLNPQNKIQLLLYGDASFSDGINKLLLISTLKFLRDCGRFLQPPLIFSSCCQVLFYPWFLSSLVMSLMLICL